MTFISKALGGAGELLTGTADAATQAYRRAVCISCPYREDTPNVGMTCGQYLQPQSGVTCGCVIDDKIPVAGASCPQGKW